MKKIIVTLLFCYTTLLNAQSLVPLPGAYNYPASANVCEITSGFSVVNVMPPTLPAPGGWSANFTLSLQIFVVSNITPPYNPNNLTALPYPWPGGSFPNCVSNMGGNPITPVITDFIGDGVTPVMPIPYTPIWNATSSLWEWNFTASNPLARIDLIRYEVYLDCALKSLLGGNLSIVQRWYYTGGIVTTPMLLTSQPPAPVPVTSPNIVPILPVPGSQFITVSAPYNPSGTSDWYFVFQNNGVGAAYITVSQFLIDVCGSYTLSGTPKYAISPNFPVFSNNITTASGVNFINNLIIPQVLPNPIPPGSYLYIKQSVTVSGCMNTCLSPPVTIAPKVHFKWHCKNADIPPDCDECQQNYDTELHFYKGAESYKIHRVTPVDAVAEINTECQGHTTPWQFEVENTGAAVLKNIDVTFNNPQYLNSFFYISEADITATVQLPCTGCAASVVPEPGFTPTYTSCSTLPGDLVNEFTIKITNLLPGGKVLIDFDIRNIPSNDAHFDNSEKFYNQWRIQSTGETGCSTLVAANYDNSIVGLNNGISGYSEAANNIYGIDDVNLVTSFYPTTTDITVPNQYPTNPYFAYESEFYSIDFSGLFGSSGIAGIDGYDVQALGAGNEISGFIKAEIECKDGLSISNPYNVVMAMPYNGAWIQILPTKYERFNCTGPYTGNVVNTVNVGGVLVNDYEPENCTCEDRLFSLNNHYILYFKISDFQTLGSVPDASLPDLFTQGKFIFGFTACCPYLTAPSNYSVKLSLLPNENCLSLNQTAPNSPVTCTNPGAGAVCCWIPLKTETGFVQVHCPGCKAPGLIVDKYAVERTSLGLEDIDNNGRLPNGSSGTQINYSPVQNALTNPYTKYSSLQLHKSVYGDQFQDYLQAHFEPGNESGGGYTYTTMMTNASISLNYIQLYKIFKETGAANYNVDVTGFDFYIDDAGISGNCLDYEFFKGYPTTIPTALHIQINKGSALWNTFFERGTGTDDDKMLFTFDEAVLNGLTNLTGLVYKAPGYTVNYVENQKYRMRVRYNVCGNKTQTPASVIADQGLVVNYMYLRGAPVNISYLTDPSDPITSEKMIDLRTDLCLLPVPLEFPGYPCPPPPSGTPVDQSNLGDAFFFYCEPFGSIHYFLSTACRNTTTYIRNEVPPQLTNNWASTDCEAIIEVQTATSFLVSNYPNTHFAYEFKKPPIIATDIKEYLPNYLNQSDWKWKSNGSGGIKAYWISTYYNFYNAVYFQTDPLPIPNNFSTTQNFVTINNVTHGPLLNCVDDGLSLSQGFIGDEASFQHIRLFMEPVNCNTFDFTPDPITNNHSEVTFGNNQGSCAPILACTTPNPLAVEENQLLSLPVLKPPSPNLDFNIAPGVYSANSGTVTWHFTLSNFAQLPGYPSPTAAKNVYIAFNSLPSFLDLTTIQVGYGNYAAGTVVLQPPYPLTQTLTGNYFWLTPNGTTLNQLSPGNFLEGDIIADVTDCSALSAIDFNWGWTCSTTDAPPSASLCQMEVATVTINSIPGNLSTFTNDVPPSYIACDPNAQAVEACFKNLTPVELEFPQTLTIIPQAGSIVQLSGATNITDLAGGTGIYSLSGGGGTWTINSTNPTLIMSDGFCIQFNVTTDGCNVGLLQLPDVIVNGTDVCGGAFSTPYTLPLIPQTTQMPISLCSDCYSITKTASVATAAPGDPVMFTVTVCGNNGSQTSVNFTDALPQFFTPSVTIPTSVTVPANGCTDIYVPGIFTDVGWCSDIMNENTATITYSTGTMSADACINVECPNPALANYHIQSNMDAFTAFGGQQTLTNEIIQVDAGFTLTINMQTQNLTLDNCIVIMGSGSSIVVEAGCVMSPVNNTLIYSCPQMWQGITLRSGATIDMQRSTIKDAERAIFLEQNSTYRIMASFIIDCVTGVETEATGFMTGTSGYIEGTQFGRVNIALKSEYPGQPTHGVVGRAGMLLNDVTLTIGDIAANENEFFNLNFGIETYNSDLIVENNRFYDIAADLTYGSFGVLPPFGCAIHARGNREIDIPAFLTVLPLAPGSTNTTITNAPVGVYNNYVNTRVNSVSMTNVTRGVNSEDNDLRFTLVAGCDINATWRGIDWRNNDGATFMTATGNTIVVNPANSFLRSPACILMTEVNPGNDANYNISDNFHLEMQSFGFGIGGLNVENAWIGYNQVFTNQGTLAPAGLIGMGLSGGGRNTVNCNGVTNTLPHAFIFTRGMDVNLSVNNRIECNGFGGGTTGNPTGSYMGMRFGGACGGTTMRGNSMRNNFEGLRLNNVGLIGAQTGVQNHNGNTWTNYQNANGAINDNVGLENLSEFRVHTMAGFPNDPLPQFHPANPNANWFVPQTGTPFSCQNSQTCMAALSGGGDDELEKMIAGDEIETAVYTDETKSMTKQYLFEKLAEDTTIITTDTIYQAFYNGNINTPIGKQYDVKTDVADAGKHSAQDLYLLQTADNLIAQKKDSIHVLDSLHSISLVNNYEILRQNLITAINTLAATKTAIRQQHETDAENKLNAAELKNTAIVSAELPETNNKLMNDVVIGFKRTGRSSIASNFAQILPVAQQCPYSGGPAVYIARAFVEMIDPTIDYDDDAVCLQSGIFREANEVPDKLEESDISIIPNPANEQIEIRINGKLEGLCRIAIVNMLGKETVIEQMACEEQSKKVNVRMLKPGVYTVRVQNNSLIKTSKLIISR